MGSNNGPQAITKGGDRYTDLSEGARLMASTKIRCSPPPLAPRAMCPMLQQVRSKATSAPMTQRYLFVAHRERNALAKQRYAEANLKAAAAARDPRPARPHKPPSVGVLLAAMLAHGRRRVGGGGPGTSGVHA